MSLNIRGRVNSAADAVIAAGNKAELKKFGTGVAIVTGTFVTVPAGLAVGVAGGAIANTVTGYMDAYRREPKLKSSFMNADKTIYAAGAAGGLTLLAGGVALALGADVTALQVAQAAGGGLVLGALGSGVVNGAWTALSGAVDGGEKGVEVGVGAAKVVGGGAQIASDATIKLAKTLCKDAVHVAEVTAHNVGEAGREGYEQLSRAEAVAAQAVADALKGKANAVSNGGPAFDPKTGKELPNKPGEYQKYD